MKTNLILALLCSLCFAGVSSVAADLPSPVSDDTRIRTVVYKPNAVTMIRVKRGVVTRIMLGTDERIEVPVSGLSARCGDPVDEWCIDASKGSNQIFVRPRDNAVRNNMELRTNKRDYSFEFEVLPDAQPQTRGKPGTDSTPFFRVVFEYPKPPTPVISREAAVDDLMRRLDSVNQASNPSLEGSSAMSPAARLKAEGFDLRNAAYSKQVLADGADAEPSLVFDDGRFTYFEFLGAREIPAIFAYGSDDQATRVNVHMQGSFVVVQRTARRFTLRLGGAVVGIFNEAFDSVGIDTPTGTVSPEVERVVVKEGV